MEVNLLNVAAVVLTDFHIYFVTVYRPPSYMALQHESFSLFLSEFCIGREVLLLRDFNLSSLDWGLENVVCTNIFPHELLLFDNFIYWA